MLEFVTWTAVIFTGICAAVWLTLALAVVWAFLRKPWLGGKDD